jgi:hypothetical protein
VRQSTRIAIKVSRGVFGILGLAFLIAALRSGAADLQSRGWPGWPNFAGALGLLLVGLVAVAHGWAILFGAGEDGHRLRFGFYVSQFGKYIPGGIWQLAGQVLWSASSTVSPRRVAELVPIHLFVQLCSGLLLTAAWAVVAEGNPAPVRFLAVAAASIALGLRRPWLDKMVALAPRFRLTRGWTPRLPDQANIWGSLAWTVVTLVVSGSAFLVLLSAIHPVGHPIRAILAFAAAWTVGFVALPFPSGIGVREAALVWLLGLPPDVVVAASISHRLVTIVGEIVVSVTAALLRRASDSKRN